MRADFISGYYYISSDSDSLFGEDGNIIRVEKDEFHTFLDNFKKEEPINAELIWFCGVDVKPRKSL